MKNDNAFIREYDAKDTTTHTGNAK